MRQVIFPNLLLVRTNAYTVTLTNIISVLDVYNVEVKLGY